MSDYIKREDAYTVLTKYYHHTTDTQHEALKEALQRVPDADVEERKTGKWEYDPDGMDWGIGAWVCSECGGRNDNIPAFVRGVNGHEKKVNPYTWAGSKYCPNCGARMVNDGSM